MKNQALEGLRGVAAVMVILSHLTLAFWPNTQVNIIHTPHGAWQDWVFNSPLTVLFSGNFAVCIFFVMSGYVLTAKFWQTGDSKAIADLFGRRYFRLMPPVLLSILIGYALLLAGANLAHAPGAPVWLSWAYTAPTSITRALDDGLWRAFLLDGADSYNPVVWTMKYEFLGSLITFAFCLLAARLQRRALVYIVAVVVLTTCVNAGVYYACFIAGIWLADGKRKPTGGMTACVTLLLALWLGGSTPGSYSHKVFEFLTITANGQITDFVHIGNAIASTLTVWIVLTNASVAAFLSRFKELGRRSFSLYLIHLSVLVSVGLWIYARFVTMHLDTYGRVAAAAATLLLSYILAGLYATWVDGRSIAFSRFAADFIFLPRHQRAAAATSAKPRDAMSDHSEAA
ncbi:acyltransferase [Paraburkholderia sp. PREW-6R]|uniref:acyltransferase family protein n=1 Tax=Paraburkholderia sp. PREW-6R TaxID=3141544 RepID=UPI0031F494FE